jgi:hypothetical protein
MKYRKSTFEVRDQDVRMKLILRQALADGEHDPCPEEACAADTLHV